MIKKIAKDVGKIHPWFISYGLQRLGRLFSHNGRHKPVHIFVCLCDHFEPLVGMSEGKADEAKGLARVKNWCEQYPKIADKYRDSDGNIPKYTFFYPIEEYRPEYMGLLADFCKQGFGEVEIHLHHDNDTADNLRKTLLDFKALLAEKYGLLCRDKTSGEIKYGFIHGNWALDNSRKDGRKCGVDNELEILEQTGCYADFTMPSAPDETQTTKINSIYYAVDNPERPNSHNQGIDATKGIANQQGLLMVQGPLMLNWRNRKAGIFPRIENSEISYCSPVNSTRLKLWHDANIHIAGMPEYIFVKLYTHGCEDENIGYLLQNSGLDNLFSFFRDNFDDGNNYCTHYVSSREMVNVIKAVEDGVVPKNINEVRDYRLEKIGNK